MKQMNSRMLPTVFIFLLTEDSTYQQQPHSCTVVQMKMSASAIFVKIEIRSSVCLWYFCLSNTYEKKKVIAQSTVFLKHSLIG